jgi:hypothetical protein
MNRGRAEMKGEGMDVYVTIFEHRHGRDVEAFASWELAVAEAAGIARESWSDARAEDASLPESAPEDDASAMELYFAAREPHEFHTIAVCPVQGMPGMES